MVDDGGITTRFVPEKPGMTDVSVTAPDRAFTVAAAIAETVSGVQLEESPSAKRLSRFELVNVEREVWPIEDLLPNGAYVH